jgi:hypothetical protein
MSNSIQINRAFERMGARVKVHENATDAGVMRIDVRRDRRGEYFDLVAGKDVELQVITVAPLVRHLLLLAGEDQRKSKFLCGHDERAWFVAAIPESARGITSVEAAREALKPAAVLDEQTRIALPRKLRSRRRTKAFVRQGEWFFIPRPDLVTNPNLILRNEPIRRGRGKPHICQEVYRRGGTRVFVRSDYPNGLTEEEYRRLTPGQRRGAQRMVRDADVYARGTVRHSDHKTIRLVGWHRVLLNTEQQAAAMRNVAFLD